VVVPNAYGALLQKQVRASVLPGTYHRLLLLAAAACHQRRCVVATSGVGGAPCTPAAMLATTGAMSCSVAAAASQA
jgi:hypothetical protein